MQTAIVFLQDAEQTPVLRTLIEEAYNRGYTRFLTAMFLENDHQGRAFSDQGLVFSIDADSIEDFPFDNLFRADRVLLVKEPLPWLCERGEEAFVVWDGCEGETLSCLGFLKAWGIPGTYINPCRTFRLETI
jgi:hypothetical protein